LIFPFPRRKNLNVILFTSVFSTDKTLAEITIKTSFIVRTLSIFRVSNLYLVDDLNDSQVKKTVTDIISYALLPPYLKRKVPLKTTLKKAGLINPVNIPSHIVEREAVEGEYRVGENGEFGLRNIKSKSKSILVINSNPLKVKSYDMFPYYNGFKTRFIGQDQIFSMNNLVIGSRSGKNPFEDIGKIKELYEKNGISLLIGPPQGGILKNINIKKYEYVYNFIPNQGVKDVRAEEALLVSLSILNYILG